jgi:histone-lysine N-methyltransferase SETMAR
MMSRYGRPFESVNEQRIVLKFYTKLGKSFFDIRKNLQKKVYGEAAPSKGATLKWLKRFKNGREATEPVAVTDEKNSGYILRDRRISVEHEAGNFAISYGTAQGIMTDRLGMRRVSARWMPRWLTSEQIELRVEMCQHYEWRYREEGD